jgi:2-isopropylmalate synthase
MAFMGTGIAAGENRAAEAATKAIDRITGLSGKILDFHVGAVTEGGEALGEADVKVDFGGLVVTGRGVSTDIVEASGLAYLTAASQAARRTPAKTPSEATGRKA